MSVISYLVSLVRGHGEAHGKLEVLLAGQTTIMTTLEQIQQKLTALTAHVANLATTQASLSTTVQNVQQDILKLKEQIGTGEPGLTAEEAAGVDAMLGQTLTQLEAVATALASSATQLQQVADIVPEDAPPPPPPVDPPVDPAPTA